MIKTAKDLLFRCHALSNIMTTPQGKSDMEKWLDEQIKIEKYKFDYLAIANKATKKALSKHAQINKANENLIRYSLTKDQKQLSESAKKQIIKTYASQIRGRHTKIKSKYLEKGLFREQDAVTLLSRMTNKFYKINKIRLINSFITGEPDLFDGEDIHHAIETLDTKCSWSYETFMESKFSELSDIYEWQGIGYEWLTGAEFHSVVYCLLNGTYNAINDEIRRLAWSMGVLDASVETDPKFIYECRQIEKNHIFDIHDFYTENTGYEFYNEVDVNKEGRIVWEFDIPIEERIHIKRFARDEDKIEAAKVRIIECREWADKNLFKN